MQVNNLDDISLSKWKMELQGEIKRQISHFKNNLLTIIKLKYNYFQNKTLLAHKRDYHGSFDLLIFLE